VWFVSNRFCDIDRTDGAKDSFVPFDGKPCTQTTMSEQETDEEHRLRMQETKKKQDAEVRSKQVRRGVVIVNEGDGKGKSTAAFGTAIRAVGHGQRVGLVQFIKGQWRTGEMEFIKRIPEIDHVISGEGFTWETQDRSRDIEHARKGFEAGRAMIEACRGDTPKYSLVILDEINIAIGHGYLPVEEVVELVTGKPEELSIILTGRGAKPELIAVADTVTRMEMVKHAYTSGIRARKGIDF
jgi:cob(I)alamin adenosyltransferase